MMLPRPLRADWKHLKARLQTKNLLLCLDYDGTLSPIAPTPKEARLPKKTKLILSKLSKIPGVSVAIISGRALDDVQSMTGIKNITYSGNHGFEIKGPGFVFNQKIPPRYRAVLTRIERTLKKQLSGFPGVIVENKRPVLAVHFRKTGIKNRALVQKIFQKIVQHPEVRKFIRVKKGKMVLEVAPPVRWDKGRITLWLLRRECRRAKGKKILPVYIGDDITDEDAFRALKNRGLTIFVGRPQRSRAQYFLADTGQVAGFLKKILSLKRS